ncbi:hypothetical protein [Kribbella sindirgiensis]|uniref:Uncharacterized protein n=1 Tax=Kribbella sindirgiensis TaxID=1124744 RepID=A0A4R0IUT6_9ACTN|nr:hypothetical protein [Kribbella sindirgiensis]TCC36937.1 hypothetical protein E0H50_09630 [Kribbella sindirgiensis]
MTLGDRFLRSDGRPIDVDGNTAHMSYEWAVPPDIQRVDIAVVRASTTVRHGISLSARGVDLRINGRLLSKAIVWIDSAPSPFAVEIVPQRRTAKAANLEGNVRIWNSWDDGTGVTHAWIGNAGILIDPQPDGIVRLHCSDGVGGVDFESLVLDIKAI